LNEFSEKFKVFFQPQDFRAIFSADDLFPFDPSSVALLISNVVEEPSPEDDEPRPGSFGIWIER
jgi:hypothetical protein